MISVAAAINSYDAIPKPIAKPEPDIPINCSAEIFEAMIEAPMAHHANDLLAKNNLVNFLPVLF